MLAAITQNASAPPPSAALEQIFAEHHRVVFAAAYRLTGSAQDADDVLQTVFLRLLSRQDELDLSPSPTSYLYRAAVNASLDLMRARRRARSAELDELDLPAPRTASPERAQEDRELRGVLRQAMLALSPRSAEIFALRFFEGLPNREIARALDMSQTAVGVALHRARAQVKKEMTQLLEG